MPRSDCSLKRRTAIEQHEPFVTAIQHWPGQVLLLAASLLAVLFTYVFAALSHAHFARFRPAILFLATWFIAFATNRTLNGFVSLTVVMLFAWGSLVYVRRCKGHFYSRRPVVTLLTSTVALCLFAYCLPNGHARQVAWSIVITLKSYVWFLMYAIVDQRSRERSPDLVQLGVQHPFWRSSDVPFGKGAAFLRRHWSQSANELAITQLKGLKLLLWMDMLCVVRKAVEWLFLSELGLPTAAQAQSAYLTSRPFPIAVGWASLVVETALAALSAAVWGHSIIGIARLAGFRLPRNMRAPLQSRSLADFWNRYYFYFKEMLVDFFYIPAFMRMFRSHPRLRMFFATFMAAGVGNAIYHFVRDIYLIDTMEPWGSVESFTSYIFYCVVLATGIGLSQLRVASGVKPSTSAFGRLWSFATIWSFVVCLHIFGDESRENSLVERLSFMASLFGVL